MRQTRSITGTGTSNLAVFDLYPDPFNVGVQCAVGAVPITYTIQYTLDDVNASGYAAASGNWFSAPTSSLVNSTTTTTGSFTTPITAARVNATVGTGTVTATFIQVGIGR